MKIALITMRPRILDKKNNLKTIEKYIKTTKADLYVTGELSLTGYGCKDEFKDLAETIDGDSITWIKKLAMEKKRYILFGMPIQDRNVTGLIHNTAVLVHPDGTTDTYNKWFLPTFGFLEEKLFFDEGEEVRTMNTKYGKIGVIICYDLFFPELCRSLSLQGANIIFCISAAPSINRKYFEAIIPARAIENTVFMVYTNIVGLQEDVVFWGGSQIYDPLGNLLVKAPYYKETVTTCELDLNLIQQARANRPVLRDIRPQIYQDLYSVSRYHKLTKK